MSAARLRTPRAPTSTDCGLRPQSCRGCELWEHATQTVFSAGPQDARMVLVGEQPGDQEDRQGAAVRRPGRAGCWSRPSTRPASTAPTTYRTNAVKHFRFTQAGPGKRRIHQTPELRHITACRPWLVAELRLVDPEVIVCLGATATKALLGPSVPGDPKDRGSV